MLINGVVFVLGVDRIQAFCAEKEKGEKKISMREKTVAVFTLVLLFVELKVYTSVTPVV